MPLSRSHRHIDSLAEKPPFQQGLELAAPVCDDQNEHLGTGNAVDPAILSEKELPELPDPQSVEFPGDGSLQRKAFQAFDHAEEFVEERIGVLSRPMFRQIGRRGLARDRSRHRR